jgi:O-antigen/teichoic acid export membrane protein
VIALAPLAPRILDLISGERFVAGAPALVILSFAIALAGITHVLRFTLGACERSRSVLIGDTIACGCAVTAFLLLIPRYSLLGAAAGTVIAEACALVAMLVGLKRARHRLPSLVNPVKALAAGAVSVFAMLSFLGLGVPWAVALVAGGLLYVGLLTLTRAIPRGIALGILGRPLAKR